MATIDIIAKRNEKLANKVITNLKSRHFDAYYAENREKALEIAVSLINKNGTVSWGGTMTAQEIGRILNMFLESISQESRVIFLRRYWFCDTIAEIAERYGISESKVKMRLLRTRNQLADFLSKEGITV